MIGASAKRDLNETYNWLSYQEIFVGLTQHLGSEAAPSRMVTSCYCQPRETRKAGRDSRLGRLT